MSEHTCAPWYAVEEPHTAGACAEDAELRYFHIYGPERRLDCKLHLSGFMRPGDAQLIAASPQLLAMVRRYANVCANCGGSRDQAVPPGCSDCQDIWDLINKAEGP